MLLINIIICVIFTHADASRKVDMNANITSAGDVTLVQGGFLCLVWGKIILYPLLVLENNPNYVLCNPTKNTSQNLLCPSKIKAAQIFNYRLSIYF